MNIPTFIRPHHKAAIENLANEYEKDERFSAIIIGGSVAKGCAREDSDIDFMIVAKDEEFKKRCKSGDLFINRTDLTNYKGGFVDGKIIDMQYLEKVVEKGNEPTRAASQLTLFAGRLILAYNRVFFPYHKWFYEYLNRCPAKPDNLIQKMNLLLK